MPTAPSHYERQLRDAVQQLLAAGYNFERISLMVLDAAQRPVDPQRSITCPFCFFVSYNANDIRDRYCGHCHRYRFQEDAS